MKNYQKTFEVYDGLKKIANQLHHQYENACNYGLTPRQENLVEKLEKQAEGLARELGYHAYHQGDPRGATLYLVEKVKDAYIHYTDGICVA